MSGRRSDHLEHRDADDWLTGDEPMTASQEDLLERLWDKAQVPMMARRYEQSKAQASREIDELQALLRGGKPVERPALGALKPPPRV